MPLKICFIAPELERGGAELALTRLAHGFAAGNHEVHVLLTQADGSLVRELPRAARVICIGNRFRPAADLNSLRGLATAIATYVAGTLELIAYLRRERPDVLIAAYEAISVMALCARAVAGVRVPVVVRVYSVFSGALGRRRDLRGRLLRGLLRLTYKRADAVVADSSGTAADLIASASIRADRVRVIYNPAIPCNLAALAGEPVAHPWLREGTVPAILAVGRLAPEKDHATLIRATAIVNARRDVRLVILGEGAERNRLLDIAKTSGIAEKVDLPGAVTNPYCYMKSCAVFVLSSLQESMSLVVVEASAVGAPVVATDCDFGPREILAHLQQGHLVPVGDAAVMATAIEHVLDRPRPQIAPESLLPFETRSAVKAYESLLLELARPPACEHLPAHSPGAERERAVRRSAETAP